MDDRFRKAEGAVKATRGFVFQWLGLGIASSWAADTSTNTNTNALADPIPALLPPREEIPPGFWEQHGLWVIVLSIAGLLLLGAIVWWLLLPRKTVPVPPAEAARRALEPLRSRAEDGLLLSQVSQVLRRYILAAFGMPEAELTTTEFCQAITAAARIEPGLAAEVGRFLRDCDALKFAPRAAFPPSGAVKRALEFIDRAEIQLAAMREMAEAVPAAKQEGERSSR